MWSQVKSSHWGGGLLSMNHSSELFPLSMYSSLSPSLVECYLLDEGTLLGEMAVIIWGHFFGEQG